jgi:hypothetical protein
VSPGHALRSLTLQHGAARRRLLCEKIGRIRLGGLIPRPRNLQHGTFDLARAFPRPPASKMAGVYDNCCRLTARFGTHQQFRLVPSPDQLQNGSPRGVICRLCHKEMATLTEEHVPPKSTGNRGAGDLEYVTFDGERSVRVREAVPDGIALKVLCARCNNRYGSSLGTGFSEFAKQVRRSGRFESPGGGIFVSAVDVFPGRIYRQFLLTFICAQAADDAGRYDGIRDYIRSRRGPPPEEAPAVSLYFNSADTYRIVPVCGVGGLGSGGRNWTGAEVAAPGLGLIFSLSGEEHLPWLVGQRPENISAWGVSTFSEQASVVLRLPRLRVNEAHPLGFGTAAEVDRWQTRKSIIWLVSGADDPTAPNSVAALWRPRRRRTRI